MGIPRFRFHARRSRPAASGSRRTLRVAPISPLEIPLRYSQGKAASNVLLRRTSGGTRTERNGAVLGAHIWYLHAHRANTCLEWAGRMMPIAHDSRVTCLSAQVRKLSQITGKFNFNCCCDQLLRPRFKQIRQRVRDPVSTCKINKVSRFNSGVSPSVALQPFNNKSTRYALNLQTPQTPDSVIASPRSLVSC